MARATRRVASRAARRSTTWIASVNETGFTAVAAAGNDFQAKLGAAALAFRPFTVVRVVGQLFVQSDQIIDSQETPFGAAGLAVVSTKASAAGGTSIPLPITDEGSELWFAYQFWAAGASIGANGNNPIYVFPFESRAMRKVTEGEDVVSVFENGSAADGCGYLLKYRMLIKLH